MRPDSFPSSPARVPVTGKNSHGRTARESSSALGFSCACWLQPAAAPIPIITVAAMHTPKSLRCIHGNCFRKRTSIPGVIPLEKVLAVALPKKWLPAVLSQSAASPQPSAIAPPGDLGVSFLNVARESGLNAKTIFGGEHKNKYLLETTGCGVAFYDYDNDGWLDIFLVTGWRLESFPAGQEPASHLFKNNRDGTFTDVTAKAGLIHSGWGQGVCVGDYDNDGFDDLFVTYFGKNVLYHNNGNGTFTDVSEKAGVAGTGKRWNTGCAFVDYDRDGHLDLF